MLNHCQAPARRAVEQRYIKRCIPQSVRLWGSTDGRSGYLIGDPAMALPYLYKLITPGPLRSVFFVLVKME
ncbi:hypothetical protein PLEOSDRAFT_1090558 [Pleurotus ostreatus PC15]|uniref:Uncharacterized protein n=1 Tax=Pleurotus ostreatus (strain PC15) TaxID=1137138 RepID=A0A067NIL6_PLEO1|nr:hypothetical protein PLEOSDRAFT_1090558 [Pleurotus ostreatus PC15]